jgi:hypothetical protein
MDRYVIYNVLIETGARFMMDLHEEGWCKWKLNWKVVNFLRKHVVPQYCIN